MNFHSPKDEPCADLLDSEPTVISGYSLTEFIFSVTFNLIFWPVLLILTLVWVLSIVICIILGVVISIIAILSIGKWLEKHKEGKPVGYYSLRIKLLINEVIPLGFINRNTQWELMRDR